MMNLICSIPDSIGWAMVGALGAFCAVMIGKLVGLFVEMWIDYHTEDEEEEVC